MDWLKSIHFWRNLKHNVTSKLSYGQWLIEAPSARKYLCHVWIKRDLDSYGFKPWNWVGIKLYHGAVISHTVSKLVAMSLFEDRFSNPSKSHMQWCHLEHWQGEFFFHIWSLELEVPHSGCTQGTEDCLSKNSGGWWKRLTEKSSPHVSKREMVQSEPEVFKSPLQRNVPHSAGLPKNMRITHFYST